MYLLPLVLLSLNGQVISFKGAQPVKDHGVVFVPARGVFQAMGARVDYDPVTRTVTAQKGETKIEMGIGRMHAWVNGNEVELPQPIRLQKGSVLIPARFVAEALGARVAWDKGRNEVLISTDVAAVDAKPSTPVIIEPIELKLSTDKRNYRVGETVKFTIVARNTTNETQVLNFRSGQSFDISVTSAGGSTPSWTWSHDQMFTEALREQTLKPKQVITFTATWNQADNSGQPMPRGKYSVDAEITANNEIQTPEISIELSQ